jgi:hypothetical protein
MGDHRVLRRSRRRRPPSDTHESSQAHDSDRHTAVQRYGPADGRVKPTGSPGVPHRRRRQPAIVILTVFDPKATRRRPVDFVASALPRDEFGPRLVAGWGVCPVRCHQGESVGLGRAHSGRVSTPHLHNVWTRVWTGAASERMRQGRESCVGIG